MGELCAGVEMSVTERRLWACDDKSSPDHCRYSDAHSFDSSELRTAARHRADLVPVDHTALHHENDAVHGGDVGQRSPSITMTSASSPGASVPISSATFIASAASEFAETRVSIGEWDGGNLWAR